MTRDPTVGTPGHPDGPPTLADDVLLTPFREADDPVLTTAEVRESTPFAGAPTAEGLERLANEGVLERKSVDDETVWWLPGHTGTDDRREPMAGEPREYDGGLSRRLEDAISTLDVSNERERVAVYAVCYSLSVGGPTTPESLRDEVYQDHSAGYDDAEQWWRECLRPALDGLAAVERDGDVWRLE